MLNDLKSRLWRSRWLAWLMLLALLALGAIALRTFLDYRSAAMDLVLEVNQQVTHLSAVRIRNELADFSEALVTLSRTPDMSSRNLTLQTQALRQALPVREGLFDGGIVLLDNFGKVIAAAPERPDLMGADWSDRDIFLRLLSSSAPVFSNATDEGPERSPVIVVSVPVLGTDGRFIGALAGMLRLGQTTISPFYASVVRLRVGSEGTTYLVDGGSRILFDSHSNRVGQPFATPDIPDPGSVEQVGELRLRDPSGRDLVASYAPIPGTPWMLVIEEDWDTLIGPTRHYVDLMLLLLGLGAILPAMGVALLVTQRNARIEEREHYAQEAQAAREIVRATLPDQVPILPGWDLTVHYQQGRTVGGAFHDFMLLSDGCLMLAVGEVNEDGVPAALTMASVRTILRGAARSLLTPAQALEESNTWLFSELPPEKVVNCLYCLLDPIANNLGFSNAGHEQPLHHTAGHVEQLGRNEPPLGLQPNTRYVDCKIPISAGDRILFVSKGILDAKNPQDEPFGTARLESLMNDSLEGGAELIKTVVAAIDAFVGHKWEPEYDVTLIVLERETLTSAA